MRRKLFVAGIVAVLVIASIILAVVLLVPRAGGSSGSGGGSGAPAPTIVSGSIDSNDFLHLTIQRAPGMDLHTEWFFNGYAYAANGSSTPIQAGPFSSAELGASAHTPGAVRADVKTFVVDKISGNPGAFSPVFTALRLTT